MFWMYFIQRFKMKIKISWICLFFIRSNHILICSVFFVVAFLFITFYQPMACSFVVVSIRKKCELGIQFRIKQKWNNKEGRKKNKERNMQSNWYDKFNKLDEWRGKKREHHRAKSHIQPISSSYLWKLVMHTN